MKISVIVPVYNASQYLNKCVDSILNQTYRNIEVVLVDDGSTDDTPLICDRLAALDNRVVVIRKVNEGPGVARQAGIAVATGEYIAFVDADDYITPAMFEKLFSYAAKENADIVQCGHVVVSPEGALTEKVSCNFQVVDGNHECISVYAKGRVITDFLWDKLFKASLFDGVTFPNFFYSEDTCVLTQVFGKAKKVVTIDELLYNHVMSLEGLCRQGFSLKRLDTINAGEFVFAYYLSRFPDLAVFAKLHICSHAAQNYCRITKSNAQNGSQLKLGLLNTFQKYYDGRSFYKQRTLNYVSLNRWLFITFFKLSPRICAFISRKVFKHLS